MEMNKNRLITVTRVWYMLISDVALVAPTAQGVKIYPNDYAEWKEIYFTPGSANLQEEAVVDGRINSWEQRFTMTLPGEDDNSINWVDEIENRKLLIKLECEHGSKLLGSMDSPCRLRVGYSMTNSGYVAKVEKKSREIARWIDEHAEEQGDASGSGSGELSGSGL